MKKLIGLTLFACVLASAGPLKVATYPVVHPVKTAKGLFKAGKMLLW